jgi:hypothetical protein
MQNFNFLPCTQDWKNPLEEKGRHVVFVYLGYSLEVFHLLLNNRNKLVSFICTANIADSSKEEISLISISVLELRAFMCSALTYVIRALLRERNSHKIVLVSAFLEAKCEGGSGKVA